MQSGNDEKIWLKEQQSGILPKWVSDIKESFVQTNPRIWYPDRSHAPLFEHMGFDLFPSYYIFLASVAQILLDPSFIKDVLGNPFSVDADVQRLAMGLIITPMIVLYIWYFRLRWQYQTFHLRDPSVYRYEWLYDLTEMRREWEALGYSRSLIRSRTFRHYRGMAWAWVQDVFIQSPIYDAWCEIRAFVATRF